MLGYLIKNMHFGNIAHVSPTTISRETKIDLPNVSRYLTRLRGDRLIDRYKTDSGTDAFFINPGMCFKGNAEARRLAIRKWEKLSFKYTKEELGNDRGTDKAKRLNQ
ncbi:replication protein (RepL) [Nitrosospira sp. Nsp14]|uniref:replication/maintenance protein RepL n=1 Tax=Nitrosospira sp. Nsp14 TaxID=1855333 RepID=UPI0008E3E5F9|nr:replication/maintenance protein RepL [Nitrosospira sp. Nsp14]SFH20091.1 replication protein (RepL) [Nitrosospira sp. Nsp14]